MSDDELDVLRIDLKSFLAEVECAKTPVHLEEEIWLRSEQTSPTFSRPRSPEDEWLPSAEDGSSVFAESAKHFSPSFGSPVRITPRLLFHLQAPGNLPQPPWTATPSSCDESLPPVAETACMQVVDLEICRSRSEEISRRDIENFRFRREERLALGGRREENGRLAQEREALRREEISALFSRTRRRAETYRMDLEIVLAAICAENFRLAYENSRMRESEIYSSQFSTRQAALWEIGNFSRHDSLARKFRDASHRAREEISMCQCDLFARDFRSSLKHAALFTQTAVRAIVASRNFRSAFARAHAAAVLVQRRVRGFFARLEILRKFGRSLLAEVRARSLKRREEISRRRDLGALKISAYVRGFLVRRRRSKARAHCSAEISDLPGPVDLDMDFFAEIEGEIGNLFVAPEKFPSPTVEYPPPNVLHPPTAAAAPSPPARVSTRADWQFTSDLTRKLFEQAQRNLNRRKNSRCFVLSLSALYL